LNTLTLASGTNTGAVSNVNTLLGGTGADTVTLGTQAINASISLGAGADKLTVGAFVNTATVSNTQSIVGGGSGDTITLGTALTNSMQVDLTGGATTLT